MAMKPQEARIPRHLFVGVSRIKSNAETVPCGDTPRRAGAIALGSAEGHAPATAATSTSQEPNNTYTPTDPLWGDLLLNFEQLKRLRDINVELLETLIYTLSSIKEYSKKHSIPLPTEDKFLQLIGKAISLIDEMNEEIALPPNFQHRFRTPKDSTEP